MEKDVCALQDTVEGTWPVSFLEYMHKQLVNQQCTAIVKVYIATVAKGCYIFRQPQFCLSYRPAGLEVKASTPGAEDPGFESCLRRDFSESSHTSDFRIGTPVATLPGAWRYRVSAGTGRPDVRIL